MLAFFRRLWTFVRPYRFRLFLGLLCGILYALASGILVAEIKPAMSLVFPPQEGPALSMAQILKLDHAPSILKGTVDRLLRSWPELKTPVSRLSHLASVMMIMSIPTVMLIRNLFGYLNVYLLNWAAVRAIADLRTRLFDHLQNLSLSFFSTARTGELIARISSDTQVLHSIISGSLGTMVKDPITVLVLLGVNLIDSERRTLTLVSVVVLPLCLVPIMVYGRKVRRSARLMQGHISELTSLMHESFSGNRIIKAYNLESTVLVQFNQTTRKYISHMMRVVRANEIPHQFTEFLGSVGIALVCVYILVYAPGSRDAGNMFTFVATIGFIYAPLKALTRLHNQLSQADAASQEVFRYLQIVNTVTDPPNPVPLRARDAEIRFQDIDFDYGDKAVFRGIRLDVKPGQMVALVGSSGSGKTTLTNLLLRFYDPKRGAVFIGGTDIRGVAIRELRSQIALVAQETILFNDTIRSNIALGRPGATEAEIVGAAKHAYAHEFIMEKPQGYDTVVGEKGAALSGGQRQRIAIARALLKDAPILVLDEAMSALDSESERVVQEALEQLMRGRTTLCIAHRLSTIQKADVIVVLDNGRIVERGTHGELMQAKGHYRRLYELQFEPDAKGSPPLPGDPGAA